MAEAVKDNEFNKMTRFGFRLAGISLLLVMLIFAAGFFLPEDSGEWLDLVVLAMAGVNVIANFVVFYFAIIGLFKSSLKWRALFSLLIALAIFALYLIAIAFASS
ncbi:hypothetical protein EDC48_102237 [Gibbsiella quercinecans]|nr:hypothetical protein [Gibbsiella quercinecans]TCT91701.1 hypothetical protein EDC48_102237 [Gibbsiella quercinecans]